MSNRLTGTMEGIISALIFSALFFIIAKIIKAIFKKDIDNNGYYYPAAVIIGFLFPRLLVRLLV